MRERYGLSHRARALHDRLRDIGADHARDSRRYIRGRGCRGEGDGAFPRERAAGVGSRVVVTLAAVLVTGSTIGVRGGMMMIVGFSPLMVAEDAVHGSRGAIRSCRVLEAARGGIRKPRDQQRDCKRPTTQVYWAPLLHRTRPLSTTKQSLCQAGPSNGRFDEAQRLRRFRNYTRLDQPGLLRDPNLDICAFFRFPYLRCHQSAPQSRAWSYQESCC